MAELKADVLVLGAGMVGVGAALHLQKRGRDVILVDKHELAGEETSYGNAGMIECASVFPYMFPRAVTEILRYATNRAPQVRYSVADLPAFLPWLVRYYLASRRSGRCAARWRVLPLIRRSLIEHEALIAEAGVPDSCSARTGWIKLFRSEATLAQRAERAGARAGTMASRASLLDAKAIAAREPNLTGDFAGAIHFPAARLRARSRRPGQGLCGAVRPQGRAILSSATRERWNKTRRTLACAAYGAVGGHAREVVVAMGPWSDLVFAPLGYSIPLEVKRGYHLHLAARGNAVLNHPVLDADQGFLLAPMNAGHSPDHRRGICPPRCAADPGPGRARAAARRMRCFRWESRSTPSPGWARGPVCRICCR